jgi:ubiquinone/menaquinone biosynthesis C-methylase UbiE
VAEEQIRHPRFAKVYARFAPEMDKAGASKHRAELLDGLSGRVIEVGAGTGLNFRHYPATVSGVVAVEPEPFLRDLAEKAAKDAPVPVEVVDGTAAALPSGDGEFDAVVASLMLCSVRDLPGALAEMRRVLRSGGELRFYEHVASEKAVAKALQRALDVVWPHVAGGCHTSRDTAAAIAAAGFEIDECRQFRFRPSIFAAPVAPHIIGVARRPAH